MSHNINFNKTTGKHSFVSAIEPAWHKLGQLSEKVMTTREALELSGLDYEVRKTETLCMNPVTGEMMQTGYFSNVRVDTGDILGNVGGFYHVVQNHDAFSFFDHFVDQSKGIIETAGALGKGEVVFITAKLPESMNINNDEVEQYVVVSNSHDRKRALTVMFTPIRVVCNNTLTAAFSRCSNLVKIYHTGDATAQLKQTANMLGLKDAYFAKFQDEMTKLYKTKMTDAQFEQYVLNLMLDSNSRELRKIADGASYDEVLSKSQMHQFAGIRDYYYEGFGQSENVGTKYGAFNAITGYLQNVKSFGSDEIKTKSLLLGRGKKLVQRAFNELANATN